MKIVCISDTHLRHDFAIPDGDVLVHAGDATFIGDESQVLKFRNWFGALPHSHKLFVPGNHDWGFQKQPDVFREIMEYYGDTLLIDQEVVIDGIKFYGSPWQPEFCNWAFNLSRETGELTEKWAAIPDDVHVLITHGPPRGVLDMTGGEYGPKESVGCYDLMDRIKGLSDISLHVFGHIHASYGIDRRSVAAGRPPITFVNASICDESYMATNAPVVIEL